MVRASEEAPSHIKPQTPQTPILAKSELIGNSFVFFLAGHETTANSIHFSILLLAISLSSQRQMQDSISSIVGSKPPSEFSYHTDMPRLYNSMVGAVLNEELRLMPAILGIPKQAHGDQTLMMDGREIPIPDGTYIQLGVVATNRNPRYWPSSPSKITPGTDDLNDFVPERWLPSKADEHVEEEKSEGNGNDVPDGLEQASYDTGSLFKPVKGSFISFSDGMRACPGRRFAQVEVTAVLTAIFQKWSVELDVSEWASDAEVEKMGKEERRAVYEKAIKEARAVIKNCEQVVITLQMKKGEKVPLRFVERGRERFAGIY
jgi:cytochrome P450